MRHQSPVRSRARSEHFYARAVRVQLHTRVFLKFKSSCTVQVTPFLKLITAHSYTAINAYSHEYSDSSSESD